MLEVILKGHDKYYGVSDVVRMFCGVLEELKDEGKVIAPEGPDITLINELFEDGRSVTYSENKAYEFKGKLLEPGREIRRSLYMALSDITSKTMPWGCLTGIRPVPLGRADFLMGLTKLNWHLRHRGKNRGSSHLFRKRVFAYMSGYLSVRQDANTALSFLQISRVIWTGLPIMRRHWKERSSSYQER